MAPVFEQIHRHALDSWRPDGGAAAAPTPGPSSARTAPGAGALGGVGCEVPVVLLSVGASADHAHTCPDLVAFLRQQVGWAAGFFWGGA